MPERFTSEMLSNPREAKTHSKLSEKKWIAVTREVSRSIARCELTHLERQDIDLARARLQHRQYEQTLEALGCEVHSLPEAPDLPDAVFVEDTAVVVDELAVIARPGAVSRQPETEAIEKALAPYRKLAFIQPPGTLDGGDVLRVGKRIFVGQTLRTNPEGIAQLRSILAPYGYTVKGVPVSGCLHLKSGVTQVGENLLLINPAWIRKEDFQGFEFIEVHPDEPYAANALLFGDRVVYPAEYPRTLERLENASVSIVLVEADELAKAEGGVTCCSLIFQAESSSRILYG